RHMTSAVVASPSDPPLTIRSSRSLSSTAPSANSPHVRQHQLLIVKLGISGEAARAGLANANAIQIVRTIKTIGAITVVVPRNFIRDLIHWRSKRFPRWSSAEKEGSKAGDGIWFRRSQKTISILFRAELTARAHQTRTPPRVTGAGSREPSGGWV